MASSSPSGNELYLCRRVVGYNPWLSGTTRPCLMGTSARAFSFGLILPSLRPHHHPGSLQYLQDGRPTECELFSNLPTGLP